MMSVQRIPIRKRYALWQAHSKRCVYCREPLAYGDLCVDHIIPQSLANDSAALSQVQEDLDLSTDFDLFDYPNWVPCHSRCNLQKGKAVFERGASRYFLGLAEGKASKSRELEAIFEDNVKSDRLLAELQLGLEQGLVQKDEVIKALEAASPAVQSDTDPLVLSFSVNTLELISDGLIPKDAPTERPALDDWFEEQLQEHIASIVSSPFFYTEASERDGETISVRIGILDPSSNDLERISPEFWELLDIERYSILYQYYLAATKGNSSA